MIRFDEKLWLFTPEEFNQLPDGIRLICIDGSEVVKGQDYIDMDTRFGYLAYGVISPSTHEYAEYFTKFRLQ